MKAGLPIQDFIYDGTRCPTHVSAYEHEHDELCCSRWRSDWLLGHIFLHRQHVHNSYENRFLASLQSGFKCFGSETATRLVQSPERESILTNAFSFGYVLLELRLVRRRLGMGANDHKYHQD